MIPHTIIHPSINPEKTLTMISLIVFLSIAAGYLYHEYFMVFAHIIWMVFTAILSFQQYKQAKKRKHSNFIELLLFNPEIRFFLFEAIAVIGLSALIIYRSKGVGTLVLIVWWLFSLNFYSHYVKQEVVKKFK